MRDQEKVYHPPPPGKGKNANKPETTAAAATLPGEDVAAAVVTSANGSA